MQQIRVLQALRGIAACAVVYGHAYSRALIAWPDVARRAYVFHFRDLMFVGAAGVDLFFVLSGFLMVYLHRDQFGQGMSWAFFKRRLARIVPLYWSLSIVGIILLYVAPRLFTHHTSREWPWIAGSFLFVPWPASTGFKEPIIGAGWTLDYEMYFYVLFAAAMLLRRGLTLLFGVMITSVVLGWLLRPGHPWAALVTNVLLLEFLMGAGVAVLVSRLQVSRAMSWLFVAVAVTWLGATILHSPGEFRVLGWGLPCALLVAGTVWMNGTLDHRVGRFTVMLGDASYSIYLFQVFALPCFAFVFTALHLVSRLPIDLIVFVVAAGSCAAGVLVSRFLERPMTDLARRYVRGKSSMPPPRSPDHSGDIGHIAGDALAAGEAGR